MNLIVINHYPAHLNLCLCGLNGTSIVGLKSIQGPVLFWAIFLFRSNIIWAKFFLGPNSKQCKSSQKATSKHHRKVTQNMTD
jgi:hypothetical protein